MNQIYDLSKSLCISAWKYGYKFSNSSVYNENSKNLVALSQSISQKLTAVDNSDVEVMKAKEQISEMDSFLESLKLSYPNQHQYIVELKTSVNQLAATLNTLLQPNVA